MQQLIYEETRIFFLNQINLKNLDSTQRKYLIEYDNLKREVKASSYQELLDQIESLLVYNGEKTKIEYWSNVFNDWLLLESLPDNESKIKISTCIQKYLIILQ